MTVQVECLVVAGGGGGGGVLSRIGENDAD